MKKGLFKRFVSSFAAVTLAFSSAPNNNARASGVLFGVGVGLGLGLIFIIWRVGKWIIEANEEYEEKMKKRQDLIDKSSSYIKKLAQDLKKIIDDDELFGMLVKCDNGQNLRNWQNMVLDINLNMNDLNKIIINLRNHWRDYYVRLSHDCNDCSIEKQVKAEVQALCDKYDRLAAKKVYEEQMLMEKRKIEILEEKNRIEKEKLQIEKEKLKNTKNLAFSVKYIN